MRLFAALLLTASAAHAWEAHRAADGAYIRWTAGVMTVRVVQPVGATIAIPGGLRKAVLDAAKLWQAVPDADVRVRFGGLIPLERAPADGEAIVQFDVGNFPGTNDVAGYTDLTIAGHEIHAAIVHLNARDFQWATDGRDDAMDVETVAGHELGHALGLAHPCGDPDTDTPSCRTLPSAVLAELEAALMYPSVMPGAHRQLSADDAQGVSTLVPAAASESPPVLTAITPACIDALGPQQFTLTQTGGARLELWQEGAAVSSVDVAPTVSIAPPAGTSDLTLVASNGKADVQLDALHAGNPCGTTGCSSAGGAWLLLLPLAAFVFRKRPALLLLFAALPAHAYKRSVNAGGLCVWWAPRGHSFMIDARGTPDVPGPAAFTAIRKSFATWSGVTCSDLSFPDLGLSQNPDDRKVGYFPGQYNRNLVLFRTANCAIIVPKDDPCRSQGSGACANAYDCWDRDENVIATTTTTSNRFTGQINDSDIEVNDAPRSDGSRNFRFTAVDGPVCSDPTQTNCVDIDVQNTITHEAGHSIGLDHTPVQDATMYASAPPGETAKRQLHNDDIQAVCDIYPKGAQTVTCLGATGDSLTLQAGASGDTTGCGCSQSQTGPGAALAGLAAFLLLKRRSRMKPHSVIIASSGTASSSLRGSVIKS